MEAGLFAQHVETVGERDTAEALGSGDLPVLGTPRLLAWAEAATVAAVAGALPAGGTTVGVKVELSHLAASPVGTTVTVRAELVEVDGRRLIFSVRADDEDGTRVGGGRVERRIVDAERFLSGVRSRRP